MQHTNQKLLLALALAVLIALSGCSSLALTGGQQSATITDVQYQLDEDTYGPVLVANYTTNDYATVIIEDAQNDVVISGEVSANNTQVTLPMGSTRGGTYTIAIQQGGETQSTREITFNGPSVEVVDTNITYRRGKITNSTVTVRNTGDIAAELQTLNYSARGQTISTDYFENRWLPRNSTRTLDLPSDEYEHISINEPGRVDGAVTINTTQKRVTTSFTRTFTGPDIEITDVDPHWTDNELDSVNVSIKNTGDLPANVNVAVTLGGETLTETYSTTTIPAGEQAENRYGGGYIYTVRDPGRYTFTVSVTGSYDNASTTFTETIRNVDSGFFSVEV